MEPHTNFYHDSTVPMVCIKDDRFQKFKKPLVSTHMVHAVLPKVPQTGTGTSTGQLMVWYGTNLVP